MDRAKIERSIQQSQKQARREDSLRGRFPLESAVAEAIEDLRYRRQSIFETPPVQIRDDRQFEDANPEHPEAISNRMVRIDASEYLYNVVRHLKGHSLSTVEEIVDFFRSI